MISQIAREFFQYRIIILVVQLNKPILESLSH